MLTAAVAVGITGPGAYSLDGVLGTALPPMAAGIIAVLAAIGFLVSVVGAAGRRRATAGTSQKAAA
jgi:hypothetical protein